MDELLTQLAQRIKIPDAEIISADEVRNWPEGKLDEYVSEGILKEIEPGRTVVCNECPDNCTIEPNFRKHPQTGQAVGVYVCKRNPDIGRLEVDPDRLRQWTVDKDKLKELGFFKEKTKRRKRKVSSALSEKEQEVYQLVYDRGLKPKQAAIELQCTDKNIYKHLKNAERKIKAQNSRSIDLSKAQALPTDKRGQVNLGVEDNEPSERGG